MRILETPIQSSESCINNNNNNANCYIGSATADEMMMRLIANFTSTAATAYLRGHSPCTTLPSSGQSWPKADRLEPAGGSSDRAASSWARMLGWPSRAAQSSRAARIALDCYRRSTLINTWELVWNRCHRQLSNIYLLNIVLYIWNSHISLQIYSTQI